MPIDSLEHNGHRLTFAEKTHRYTLDGKPVKSVTHYTGLTSKPNLVWWAARCAVEIFQEHISPGMEIDLFLYDKICDLMKKEHSVRLKESADFGTDVHKEIEKHISGSDMGYAMNSVALHTRSALKWLDKNVANIILKEKLIFSVDDWYSGRLDMYVELLNGHNAVIDIKTGSGLYPEHILQTAAYLKALIEMNLAGPSTRIVLRTTMGEPEIKVRPWETFGQDYDAFKGLLKYGNWLKENE